jgi:hypothetical protein
LEGGARDAKWGNYGKDGVMGWLRTIGTPFQGYFAFLDLFPGRCPGLV